eukprot:jgi/Mesen1/2324/ME000155S01417
MDIPKKKETTLGAWRHPPASPRAREATALLQEQLLGQPAHRLLRSLSTPGKHTVPRAERVDDLGRKEAAFAEEVALGGRGDSLRSAGSGVSDGSSSRGDGEGYQGFYLGDESGYSSGESAEASSAGQPSASTFASLSADPTRWEASQAPPSFSRARGVSSGEEPGGGGVGSGLGSGLGRGLGASPASLAERRGRGGGASAGNERPSNGSAGSMEGAREAGSGGKEGADGGADVTGGGDLREVLRREEEITRGAEVANDSGGGEAYSGAAAGAAGAAVSPEAPRPPFSSSSSSSAEGLSTIPERDAVMHAPPPAGAAADAPSGTQGRSAPRGHRGTHSGKDLRGVGGTPGDDREQQQQAGGGGRQPKLILHMDINKTILIRDQVQEAGSDSMVNVLLSECAWGRLLPGPQWIPTNEDIKVQRQALKRTFTEPGQPGDMFRGVYERLMSALRVPEESVAAMRAARLGDGHEVVLLPSFFELLRHLAAQRRDFAVVFRTFGTDLPEIAAELNLFCRGLHPFHPGVKLDGSDGRNDLQLHFPDSVGCFFRHGLASDGTLLAMRPPPEVLALRSIKPEVLERCDGADLHRTFGEIYEALLGACERSGANCALALRDYYPVDARDVRTGQPIAFHEAHNRYLLKVEPLHAILDKQYFIRAVRRCEEAQLERDRVTWPHNHPRPRLSKWSIARRGVLNIVRLAQRN